MSETANSSPWAELGAAGVRFTPNRIELRSLEA